MNRSRPSTTHDPLVYAIAFDGGIKIGATIDLRSRARGLKIRKGEGELLAAWPGYEREEAAVMRQLDVRGFKRECELRGDASAVGIRDKRGGGWTEWYIDTPELRETLAHIRPLDRVFCKDWIPGEWPSHPQVALQMQGETAPEFLRLARDLYLDDRIDRQLFLHLSSGVAQLQDALMWRNPQEEPSS